MHLMLVCKPSYSCPTIPCNAGSTLSEGELQSGDLWTVGRVGQLTPERRWISSYNYDSGCRLYSGTTARCLSKRSGVPTVHIFFSEQQTDAVTRVMMGESKKTQILFHKTNSGTDTRLTKG